MVCNSMKRPKKSKTLDVRCMNNKRRFTETANINSQPTILNNQLSTIYSSIIGTKPDFDHRGSGIVRHIELLIRKWTLYQHLFALNINDSAISSNFYAIQKQCQLKYLQTSQCRNSTSSIQTEQLRSAIISRTLVIDWINAIDIKASQLILSPKVVQNINNIVYELPSFGVRCLAISEATLPKPTEMRCIAQIVRKYRNRNGKQKKAHDSWCASTDLQLVHNNTDIAVIGHLSNNGIYNNEQQLHLSAMKCDEIKNKQYFINEKLHFNNDSLLLQFPKMSIIISESNNAKYINQKEIYAIEIVTEILLDNGQIIRKTIISTPFMLSTSNNIDDDASQMRRIIRHYLQRISKLIDLNPISQTLPWSIVREFLRNVFKTTVDSTARLLDREELLHHQCILFVGICQRKMIDVEQVERELFGNILSGCEREGFARLKYRLLREFVCDNTPITLDDIFLYKCASLEQNNICQQYLGHTFWQWISSAICIIRDASHTFCPLTNNNYYLANESDEYSIDSNPTMLDLFNRRLITLCSQQHVWKVYKTIYLNEATKKSPHSRVLMIRFCDKTCANLIISFTNICCSNLKPTHAQLSAVDLLNANCDLIDLLMNSTYMRKFERIVVTDADDNNNNRKPKAAIRRKDMIFMSEHEQIVTKVGKNLQINLF